MVRCIELQNLKMIYQIPKIKNIVIDKNSKVEFLFFFAINPLIYELFFMYNNYIV